MPFRVETEPERRAVRRQQNLRSQHARLAEDHQTHIDSGPTKSSAARSTAAFPSPGECVAATGPGPASSQEAIISRRVNAARRIIPQVYRTMGCISTRRRLDWWHSRQWVESGPERRHGKLPLKPPPYGRTSQTSATLPLRLSQAPRLWLRLHSSAIEPSESSTMMATTVGVTPVDFTSATSRRSGPRPQAGSIDSGPEFGSRARRHRPSLPRGGRESLGSREPDFCSCRLTHYQRPYPCHYTSA
jgi:hypothetical protein